MPRGAVPTLNQLEARIDEALVIARASEDGVREVGEMALDAARQARRAAEAAEKSARAAVDVATQASWPAGPVSDSGLPLPGGSSESSPPAGGAAEKDSPAASAGKESVAPRQPRFEVRFRSFNERADRVAARLRALQEQRSHPGAPSAVAARRRGDG